MKNQKGQALVEFILILPVFLLLIIGSIDIANIILKKYELENDLDEIVELYETNKESQIEVFVQNHNLKIDIEKNSNNSTITLSKETTVATPILNSIISNPYKIEASRTVYMMVDD